MPICQNALKLMLMTSGKAAVDPFMIENSANTYKSTHSISFT